MKLLVLLALAAACVALWVALRRPAPSTWCTAEPVKACATIHPTTTTRRR